MAALKMLGAFRQITRQSSPLMKGHVLQRQFSLSSVMAGQNLRYEVKDNVGVVTIDMPGKVNTLNASMMAEFEETVQQINSDSNVQSVVLISSKPDCFIAGADINMLQAATSAAELEEVSKNGQKILQKIEDSSKPIVAAIMGACLGGGLEVALACHYRVAMKSKNTGLGLPEVMLGLLPGAGGTQRLPQTVSPANAFDMMLTGKTIRADKAKKMGLVDAVVAPLGPGIKDAASRSRDYLEEVAIQTAKSLATGAIKKTPRKKGIVDKVMDKMLSIDAGRNYFFKQVRSKVMKQSQGLYPAPLKIIDVVRTGIEKGPKAGFEAEAKNFGELGQTDVSEALIGLFHGQTACKKNSFGKPQTPVKNLAVLGAGLMGAGIAQVSIDKGMHTILKDMSTPGLVRGQQQVESGLRTAVKKKKLTQFEADTILTNLDGSINYDNFDKVDMVIEAVFEDMAIKHKVIKEVEPKLPEHAVFATNTSALPIRDIAKASARPEKVIGMHYFSPVDKMQLLEIIKTDQTSQDTIASAVDVGLRQGKVVIVVGDGPGFYTTRLVTSYASEAFNILLEGMEPKKLDSMSKKFGFPVGSAALIDEVGIDIALHVGTYLSSVFGERMGFTPQIEQLCKLFVEKGFMGRKTGKGVYIYEEGQKNKEVNAELFSLAEPYITSPKLPLNEDNIRMRLISRFANEAAMCLEDGILVNPLEGDIGAVFGLGFPPNHGGPFRFIDAYGADKFVTRLRELEEGYGSIFTPCQLLLDYAKQNKKFHSK